ncbi:hypothetical protein [Aeromonas schubertii]|uniref:hypothetical protein n=1 Tax=Aeromonas schubertii TaxID=652 RepID=UPI0010A81764|nr:hypothetical protein [Aeromonas schubertii]QCG47185.1 hypothetical protein E2P79_04340 [Aeromonas schubertii]
MTPERITTSQLFGSFTSTHWKAAISGMFIVLSTIAGGAFWVGQKLTEAQSLLQQSELKGALTQLQTKLEVAHSQVESLVNENAQLHKENKALESIVKQKDEKISNLIVSLNQTDNCKFIHEQIRATLVEINSTGGIVVFNNDEHWEEKQKIRRAMLEKRLEGYQLRLGSCNK